VLPRPLDRLLELFTRLPGVGEKTAARFVLHLIGAGALARDLGGELTVLLERIRPCQRCGNWAEIDAQGASVCAICSDPRRDPALICVVARVQDLLALEKSGAMRGRYFVLGRLLSPLDGIGPEELPLGELNRRIDEDGAKEVILATPLSVEGEATALYLAHELKGKNVRVSRIASGVPHGGDLEYADQITLGRAIDGRRLVEG
jgi:recombination protein RecR